MGAATARLLAVPFGFAHDDRDAHRRPGFIVVGVVLSCGWPLAESSPHKLDKGIGVAGGSAWRCLPHQSRNVSVELRILRADISPSALASFESRRCFPRHCYDLDSSALASKEARDHRRHWPTRLCCESGTIQI